MDKIHKIQPYLPYQLMLLRTAVQVQKKQTVDKRLDIDVGHSGCAKEFANASEVNCNIQEAVVIEKESDTIRYDTRCYFNVRSKADISQLNLPHGTDN